MNKPTLLMVNKLASEHMPIEYWAKLLGAIAKDSKVPIGVHLDHCNDFEVVVRAIKAGFSSVMYDGSQLSLEENINRTKEIVKIAKIFDVSVEGEVGSVPYADIPGHAKDILTSADEAAEFTEKSGVDWVAVAIGQVHRLQSSKSKINFEKLKEIQCRVSIPIVIHGGSGIREEDLIKMKEYKIGKINVGTSLRLAFGETLKKVITENPQEYDRIKMFNKPMIEVKKVSENMLSIVN